MPTFMQTWDLRASLTVMNPRFTICFMAHPKSSIVFIFSAVTLGFLVEVYRVRGRSKHRTADPEDEVRSAKRSNYTRLLSDTSQKISTTLHRHHH
jgi:hypothetical protein